VVHRGRERVFVETPRDPPRKDLRRREWARPSGCNRVVDLLLFNRAARACHDDSVSELRHQQKVSLQIAEPSRNDQARYYPWPLTRRLRELRKNADPRRSTHSNGDAPERDFVHARQPANNAGYLIWGSKDEDVLAKPVERLVAGRNCSCRRDDTLETARWAPG
jgi:hypothetical protein